jgi:deoxyribose-phosphate aldolase
MLPDSLTPPMLPAKMVAAMIDHTLLKADTTQAAVQRLCAEAREHAFATVCVNPYWVELAAGEGVTVAAVVGFPLGANVTAIKLAESERAVRAGAAEIDMVLNVGELIAGNLHAVGEDIRAVVGCGAPVKVIFETALLNDDQKRQACDLSLQAGAAFVKTSTGFASGGATVADVALMRAAVGTEMGVKASGGIRTWADCRAMIEAGANRIGTSAGIAILQGMQA